MINAPWAEGAIGTAHYVGVSLKKVIKHCGGLLPGAKHLELIGAETYFKQNRAMNYAVSVPWSKVRLNEVILAWSMNGEPLPLIHGYPLRVVVLGYIGARSVKWLYRINALAEPSTAPVQSREYLYFNQQVGKHNQRWTDGIQIQEMPVSSAIMSPLNKQVVVHTGQVRVNGWAYSGGGRWPERVEVSRDGGFAWYAVPLENMSEKHKYAWRTWWVELPVDAEGWLELVVRCWDNSLNTQPTEVRNTWNWGLVSFFLLSPPPTAIPGPLLPSPHRRDQPASSYLINETLLTQKQHVTSSAHRIKIYSVNKARPQTARRLKEFARRGESLVPITRPTEFPYQSWESYEEHFRRFGPRDVDV